MSKVIKRGEAGDISPDTGFAETNVKRAPIIRSDIADAKNEAQSIRERALVEMDDLRQKAQEETQRALEEAKERGYQEGYQEGRNAGATELAEIVAQSSQRLAQIEAQAEPQLKTLALAIAKKIIGKELEFHPEAVVDIIKQALSEKARQRREIVLRVNPEDMSFVREHKAELLEVLSRCKEIGIREDPDVSRHGVVIETDAGLIDAQLETQLEVFERILKQG